MFFFKYHRLLKLMYGDKWNKSLTAKEWANTEGLPVREVQCHMDMEMFLEGQAGWEWGAPSVHHPARDVSACCGARAERRRMYDPLRLPTQPPEVGPKGRHLCHPAGRTSD